MARLGVLAGLALALRLCLAGQVVLVDRSGSMRPYFERGTVEQLTRALVAVCSQHSRPDLAVFSTSVKPVKSTDDPDFNYETFAWSFTEIDKAAKYVADRKYDIGWIVTDNIQHQPDNPEGAHLSKFYELLRGPRFKKVYFFPVLQPAGIQGLTVYALLLDWQQEQRFEEMVTVFAKRVQQSYQTEALLVKPLGRSTVEAVPVLEPRSRRYVLGQGVNDSIQIGFTSRFRHISFRTADISEPRLYRCAAARQSGLGLGPVKYHVQPTTVPGLSPGQSTGPGFKLRYKTKVTLTGSLLKAAFAGGKVNAPMELPVHVNILPSDLSLTPEYKAKYDAATPDDARRGGKVFGINRLPSELSEAAVRCSTLVTIPIEADYGPLPALLLFLILALVAVAAVVTYRVVKPWLGQQRLQVFARLRDKEVQCRIDNDTGGLVMERDVLGKIDAGRVFRPAMRYRLADGQEHVRLVPGLEFKLSRHDGAVIELFCGPRSAKTKGKPLERPSTRGRPEKTDRPLRR